MIRKTLTISKELWRKLTALKLELESDSLDEVISLLLTEYRNTHPIPITEPIHLPPKHIEDIG